MNPCKKFEHPFTFQGKHISPISAKTFPSILGKFMKITPPHPHATLISLHEGRENGVQNIYNKCFLFPELIRMVFRLWKELFNFIIIFSSPLQGLSIKTNNIPTSIYLFEFNNGNARIMWERTSIALCCLCC